MRPLLALIHSGGMEGMTGFFLPWDLHQPHRQQQQQIRTAWLCFPARPMLVAPPSCSLAHPPLPMDQSLTNLGLQGNQPRAVLPQQHTASLLPSHEWMTSFLLSELDKSRERMMELEACLRRAEEEREAWQRIAREHEAMVASLKQTLEQLREPSIGSLQDADDAASCAGHPLAAEERRDGTGVGPCNAWGPPDSRVPPLRRKHLCACELAEAFLGDCPLCESVMQRR